MARSSGGRAVHRRKQGSPQARKQGPPPSKVAKPDRGDEAKTFQLFQSSAMAAVLFKLPEVTIVDVNQATERLLGYT
jgi:hypothetical protein